MLRRVRAVIAARIHDDAGELIENWTNGIGRKQRGCEFGSEVFENQALREAAEISLRNFAFLRSVMSHGGEQHADGAAAGLFHGRVNRAGGFFRGKAAGALHRGSEMADKAERV